MAQREAKVVIFECDACGLERVETDNGEPVSGITLRWSEIDVAGGYGGELWVCSEKCALKAFRNRHEIEREKDR